MADTMFNSEALHARSNTHGRGCGFDSRPPHASGKTAQWDKSKGMFMWCVSCLRFPKEIKFNCMKKQNLAVAIESQLNQQEVKSTTLNVCRWNEQEIADATDYFKKLKYNVRRSFIPNELEVTLK